MLPKMSVTLLTKGSRDSHCGSFAACCTNCQHCSTCPIKTSVSQFDDSHVHQNHKSFISLVTEECVILHKLSVTDMTEGYLNVHVLSMKLRTMTDHVRGKWGESTDKCITNNKGCILTSCSFIFLFGGTL